MAKIFENSNGRRTIRLNTDEVIDIVREFQTLTCNCDNIYAVREKLLISDFYLPEDL